MKKKLVTILLIGFMLVGVVGCKGPSDSDLNSVNNKIIGYFSSDNSLYDNLSFNYVDLEKRRVIVGLLDNSKEQQDRFRKMAIDSEYIEFVQGQRHSF